MTKNQSINTKPVFLLIENQFFYIVSSTMDKVLWVLLMYLFLETSTFIIINLTYFSGTDGLGKLCYTFFAIVSHYSVI